MLIRDGLLRGLETSSEFAWGLIGVGLVLVLLSFLGALRLRREIAMEIIESEGIDEERD